MHRTILLCAAAAFCGTILAAPVAEASTGRREARGDSPARAAQSTPAGQAALSRTTSGGISCVPYARQATGMAITGNGRDWWHNAAGLYARGSRPEPGSVMAFPGSGGMPSGHVAVVERVVSPREVTIHHANWGGPGIRRGSVMRGVSVVDVSEENDWTAVRVQVGHNSGAFGRVYPVYGFIHNRPDPTGGTLLAGTTPRGRSVTVVEGGRSASLAELRGRYEEVAASGERLSPHARQHMDLTRTGMSWGR